MTGGETNRKIIDMTLIGSSGNCSFLFIHKRKNHQVSASVGVLPRLGDLAWRPVWDHFGRYPIVEAMVMSARVWVALFYFSQLYFTASFPLTPTSTCTHLPITYTQPGS